MFAPQTATDDAIVTYLANPVGMLWDAVVSDDVVAAAYAMYYFTPLDVLEGVGEDPFDGGDPLEAAAYHCLLGGFSEAYASYVWGQRQGKSSLELDNLITNIANDYMPEPIIDAELLAMGAMPLPWMGFDWDYQYAATYSSLRDGFALLAEAIGLIPVSDSDEDPYTGGFDKTTCWRQATLLADSLHIAGYGDIAAALRWMTGTTVSDLLNMGYEEAAHSELRWPGIDEADVWREEARLCDLYTDYALAGIGYLEATPALQEQLRFNTLLLTYQQTLEEHHVRVSDASIQQGLVWPRRDSDNAPEPADDLDVLSFWDRA